MVVAMLPEGKGSEKAAYVPFRGVPTSFLPRLLERAWGGSGEEEGTREEDEISFFQCEDWTQSLECAKQVL